MARISSLFSLRMQIKMKLTIGLIIIVASVAASEAELPSDFDFKSRFILTERHIEDWSVLVDQARSSKEPSQLVETLKSKYIRDLPPIGDLGPEQKARLIEQLNHFIRSNRDFSFVGPSKNNQVMDLVQRSKDGLTDDDAALLNLLLLEMQFRGGIRQRYSIVLTDRRLHLLADVQSNPERGMALVEDALMKTPDDLVLQCVKAEALWRLRKLGDAEKLVTQILSKSPNLRPALIMQLRIDSSKRLNSLDGSLILAWLQSGTDAQKAAAKALLEIALTADRR